MASISSNIDMMEFSQAETAAESPEPTSNESSTPEAGADGGSGGDPAAKAEESVAGSSTDASAPEAEPIADTEAPEETSEEPGDEITGDEGSIQDEQATAAELIALSDGTEINPQATVQVPVDGKMMNVTIDELRKDFSARTAVKERFAEANTIKQKAQHQERQAAQREFTVKRTATRFIDAMSKGHTRDAVDALCEFTGQNADEVWAQVHKAQRETISRLSQMDPREWALYEAQQEAAYANRKLETGDSHREEDALYERKLAAQEKYSITDGELEDVYKRLVDAREKKEYNGDITLDACVERIVDERTWATIDNTCQERYPALFEKLHQSKKLDEFYWNILQDTKTHNLTQADWISLFDELSAEHEKAGKSKAASTLAKKVAKNTSPTQSKKNTASSKSAQSGDLLDIVDLDEI